MSWTNKFPEWKNEGIEPSTELKNTGYVGGYKPPASVFNWFWSKVMKAITEIQSVIDNKPGKTVITNSNKGEIFNNYASNTASGNYSHSEGDSTFATAESSHAEGTRTVASAIYAHAEGLTSKACGAQSHSEGKSTIASGDSSHAEGTSSEAQGMNSHAEGGITKAIEQNSHAEGYITTAKGANSHVEGNKTQTTEQAANSHAEGYNTVASDQAAHAEGTYTTASNLNAHAEGTRTVASGDSAHAEGWYSEASGNYSHASGYYTKATGESQTVVGKYNAADNDALFIVGKGNSASRSNAFTVKKDGTVSVGKYPVNSTDVATKQYVDDNSSSNKADASYGTGGGFVGGTLADLITGGGGAAVGNASSAYDGGAIGKNAASQNGGAIGYNSVAANGGAVGSNAKAGDGFAGGNSAYAVDAYDNGIDAIQLGGGTNSVPGTMQVYNKRIVEADGSLTDVGNLTDLNTAQKDSIVSAINNVNSNKADKKSGGGGFVGGEEAFIDADGTGGAIGLWARSTGGGAIGDNCYSTDGGAIGKGSAAGDGFAGGKNAQAVNSNLVGIDAIQLGTGVNNTPKTLQVYENRIVEADGSLTDVGILSDLNTTAKDNVVSAINELKASLSGIKIETGSYIGTGTSGETGKNTLTFNFKPKLVFITSDGGKIDNVFLNPLIFNSPKVCGYYQDDTSTHEIFDLNIEWGDNSVSWYSSESTGNMSVKKQHNESIVTYYWVAIG